MFALGVGFALGVNFALVVALGKMLSSSTSCLSGTGLLCALAACSRAPMLTAEGIQGFDLKQLDFLQDGLQSASQQVLTWLGPLPGGSLSAGIIRRL